MCKLKSGVLQECSKLAQQINRVYGANKQLTHPAHIYLTGLKTDGLIQRELRNKCSGFDNYKVFFTFKRHRFTNAESASKVVTAPSYREMSIRRSYICSSSHNVNYSKYNSHVQQNRNTRVLNRI